MKYLIRRMNKGFGYLTPSGSEDRYTRELKKARIYVGKEQAERCRDEDHEILVPLHKAWDL